MSGECERCGTETENHEVHGSRAFWFCDRCQVRFDEWLSAEEKPPVRGGCSSCGGPVEVSAQYKGGHNVKLVLNCPKCGWTGTPEGSP